MNQIERAGQDARTIHRDSAESNRPSVDIRVVLFTLASGELLVGRSRDERSPGLPRDIPVRSESLDVTARRIVLERLSIQEQYIEQLYTLSVADPIGGWSVIVAYLALVCSSGEPVGSESISWEPAADVAWISDTDRLVTDYAITRLRASSVTPTSLSTSCPHIHADGITACVRSDSPAKGGQTKFSASDDCLRHPRFDR